MGTLIPLLAYGWSDNHCSGTTRDDRYREHRTRLWTVVEFTTPEGERYSCDAKVIMAPFPDFCGGMIVHSPQVQVHTAVNDSWSNSPRSFTHPACEHEIGLSFLWTALDQHPDRILNLAEVTGQERWTVMAVEDLMMASLAQGVLTETISRGKRGIVAADADGGHMANLMKAIGELDHTFVPVSFVSRYSQVDDVTDANKVTWHPHASDSLDGRLCDVVVDNNDLWQNVNSGNRVSWLNAQISLENDGDDDYDEYDEYEDVGNSPINVHPAVTRVYANRNFVRGVPRHFWRNG